MTEPITKVVEKTLEVAQNSDAIQTKVVSVLDALQNGAAEVGNQVVKYTPDVIDAGLWVVRIDGLQVIFWGVISLCLVLMTRKWVLKIWTHAIEEDKNTHRVVFIVPFILTMPSVFLCAVAYCNLFNIWNWVAIFEPKLYLAKQIIASVIK